MAHRIRMGSLAFLSPANRQKTIPLEDTAMTSPAKLPRYSRQEIEQFLLDDLARHLITSSYDLDADERFAEFLGLPQATDAVMRRRIAAFRRLRQQGKVTSGWAGCGAGSWSEIGRKRALVYQLVILPTPSEH